MQVKEGGGEGGGGGGGALWAHSELPYHNVTTVSDGEQTDDCE